MSHTEQSTELSVVVPAYNEGRRLAGSLRALHEALSARAGGFEVLVVDDGSRDDTADVARRFADRGVVLLQQPYNQGKGAALRRGVLASRGREVLLTDADLSTPIDDLARLEALRGEAEVVLGSRAVPGARLVRRQPRYRELMGKIFNKLIRLFGVHGLADTQCGFKLLDGEVARSLFAELFTDGFAYDVELVWLARRAGHRVVETGVTWIDSPDSRVRPIRDSLAMLVELVRFRWHHRGQ